MDLRDTLQSTVGASYTIERELGGGGMARVFVAMDTALRRRVVVKVLPPELSGAVSSDRFKREIQLAAQLQHPHIVPVLAAGEAAALMYYTMPFVEGESLRASLTRSGEMPVGDALRVLRDVAAALAYAHKHGVIHRDIKPDNILLSDGYAVVTDFGVAKAIRASATDGSGGLTSLGVALGTPAYMAPEQAAADPIVDHRADIYAFGILAYELLTGATPFAGRPAAAQLSAHIAEQPEPLERRRPGVSPALADLVDRCLKKRPADRPQTAEELVRALDAIVATPTGMSPAAARAPFWRARRRMVAAGIATVGIAAVITAFAIRGPSGPPVDDQVIAVFPFRVSSSDPAVGYLREGMQDLLSIKLTTDAGMRASDVRAVLTAMKREGGDDLPPEKLAEIAADLGAGQVLSGEIVGTPGRLLIRASLTPLQGQGVQASVQGASDSVSHLVDLLAGQLLSRRAGESAERAVILAQTPLGALRAYLDGRAQHRKGQFTDAAANFRRAAEIDSTFAPAVLGEALARAWAGGGGPQRDSVRARAWSMRDRLTRLDRLRMEAEFGARTPGFTPGTELIAAAERFAAAAPDNIDAWYTLGDAYFHFGPQTSLPDAFTKALTSFNRALAMDSSHWAVAEHLPVLYHLLGDTAGRRRAVEHLQRLDSTAPRAKVAAWFQAAALDDSIALKPAEPSGVDGLKVQAASDHGIGVRAADDLMNYYKERTVTGTQRRNHAALRRLWTANAGRPAEAAVEDSIASTNPSTTVSGVWLALFSDGDSAWAARAAAAMRGQLHSASMAGAQGADLRVFNLSALVLWSDRTGAPAEAESLLSELRGIAALPDTVRGAASARLMVLTVEALRAERQGRPDARQALTRLDAAARTAPAPVMYNSVANLISARLWEKQGRPDMALAATRRRLYGTQLAHPFLSTLLREEGRFAEMTGDREGAIRAYRHYLALRYAPEPALEPETRDIAARVARLERASAGR